METITPNTEPVTPAPNIPNEDVELQPGSPGTEIDPSKVGNETEVDLDKEKIRTYPPETH